MPIKPENKLRPTTGNETCTREPMTKKECHAYDNGMCFNGFVCVPETPKRYDLIDIKSDDGYITHSVYATGGRHHGAVTACMSEKVMIPAVKGEWRYPGETEWRK